MLTWVLLFCIGIYTLFGFFLYIKQRDLLYFPTPPIKHPFIEKEFINDNLKIKTTVLNKGKRDAIIYFGGNAEIVDYNGDPFYEIFPNHTIYLVKYRGYSGSEGTPTEEGIYSDALYIYEQIQTKYENIATIGRSLGSGVSTYLASKRDIEKLILITPFDSIENVAQKLFPLYPMKLLLKDKFNSIDRVPNIKSKILIIAAKNDETIKPEHTKKLADSFPSSQILFKIIENTGHNDISDTKEYYQILKDFITIK